MKRLNLSLRQRLDIALAENSATSSAVFILVAILFYSMKFERGLSQDILGPVYGLIVIVNLCRFIFARKFLQKESYHSRLMKTLKVAIFFNGILWGVVLSGIRDFVDSGDSDSFFVLMAVSGMSASSVITLASSRWLAWFFQWCLLVPSIVIISIEYFEGKSDMANIAIFLTVFVAYLFKQTKDSHQQMRDKIDHEMSLEKSNNDLKFSNQRIIEETAKSQHSARLAAIGEMAGGIAHEINTPLAVMLSNVEFLESLYQNNREQFDQTYEARSSKVKSAIERVSKIIKGLRSFAQQNDRQPKEEVNLKVIIDETLDFCAEKLRQNGVELRYKQIPDTPIMCHSVQISQVILNLINNSFYEVSFPEVSEKWIELVVQFRENDIKISAIDSGRGVPLEYQTKLFQPFFTSKGVGKGTGLGLSISKGIMRDHGGDLFFDPNSKHTKFDMILPRGKAI